MFLSANSIHEASFLGWFNLLFFGALVPEVSRVKHQRKNINRFDDIHCMISNLDKLNRMYKHNV
ncbi:hypothetical protein Syun_026157 [Stephania yunnanensis]|uniref:Uncharacterized protein n=1 Tax=Stephania yunnanensis TaxID=152371 RepID=A0AAP0EVW1_9MAGN